MKIRQQKIAIFSPLAFFCKRNHPQKGFRSLFADIISLVLAKIIWNLVTLSVTITPDLSSRATLSVALPALSAGLDKKAKMCYNMSLS